MRPEFTRCRCQSPQDAIGSLDHPAGVIGYRETASGVDPGFIKNIIWNIGYSDGSKIVDRQRPVAIDAEHVADTGAIRRDGTEIVDCIVIVDVDADRRTDDRCPRLNIERQPILRAIAIAGINSRTLIYSRAAARNRDVRSGSGGACGQCFRCRQHRGSANKASAASISRRAGAVDSRSVATMPRLQRTIRLLIAIRDRGRTSFGADLENFVAGGICARTPRTFNRHCKILNTCDRNVAPCPTIGVAGDRRVKQAGPPPTPIRRLRHASARCRTPFAPAPLR